MDSKLKPYIDASLAVAASAALYYWGTGLHPRWFLTWWAPLPILFLASRSSRWTAGAAAFLAFALGEINLVGYAKEIIPLPVLAFMLIAPAAIFALFVMAYRSLVRRGRPALAVICLPAFWVAYEFLSEMASPHSTFGNLAYTQMDCLPVLQLTSLTGIWSVSFLLFLFPAAMASIFVPATATRHKAAVALGTLAIFGAVFAFGEMRLHSAASGMYAHVALIDIDKPGYPEGEASLKLMRAYAAHVPELTREGAELIVIPEKIGRFSESDVRETDELLQRAASENHVAIVAGLLHQPDRNEARVYSPDGLLEATYEKHHMLPPFESNLLVGTNRTILNRQSGKWGVEICKDMDFPELSRQYGRDGIGLLIVPAWDFDADGWLHGRMAILRGVESGFSIARAVKQGILTVTDSRGRVLAEKTTSATEFATLVANVPVENERTFYSRAGDWFAWLDLGLAALLAVIALRIARKPTVNPA